MKVFCPLIVYCLCMLTSLGQVPVSKEPRHHNAFENAYVRVLDVHIPPGDTTQFHKHETPSVFIMLSPVKTGSEVIMEEAKATVFAKDASISFEGFYLKPRIHRVWNEDTSEFHVMDVEILSKGDQNIGAPVKQEDFQLLFDEKPVRVYRLHLSEEGTANLQREAPVLVVGLNDTGGSVIVNNTSFGKKGNFLFVPAGQAIHFSNKNAQPYSFAVLEFK